MFSFKVVDVPLSFVDDSISNYLDVLEQSVLQVLSDESSPLTEKSAHTLCEYVDSVDGKLLPMQEPRYRDVTSLIAGYLLHCEEDSRRRLCGKNWTANTLMNVLRSSHYKQLPGEVYPTELVA
jgi:hypothetical protein